MKGRTCRLTRKGQTREKDEQNSSKNANLTLEKVSDNKKK